jgi:translation initiation factor eIF-2B subunit delta
MINYLEHDRTSGANELIDLALEIIETQLDEIKDPDEDIKEVIIELAKHLFNAKPSMAPLINTVGYIIHDLKFFNKYNIHKKLNNFQLEKERIDTEISRVFNDFLKSLNSDKLNVMLISYSSTVTSRLMNSEGIDFRFFILESRPLYEGRRTAKLLSSKFKTDLIVDSAMGMFIDDVDLILVGIDSILRDGSIVNKIGTYPLACLGTASKKPVYAVGDSFKYNLKSHHELSITIEPKPIFEVYSDKIKGESLHIHNYYFDITPPIFFNGIISDLGVLTNQEFLEQVKQKLPLKWYESFIKEI